MANRTADSYGTVQGAATTTTTATSVLLTTTTVYDKTSAVLVLGIGFRSNIYTEA